MAIDDQMKDEKLQYDINWEAAEISAISAGTINKYKHFTSEETLPSEQSRIIEQAKLASFWKTKSIEDKGNKKVRAIHNQKIYL